MLDSTARSWRRFFRYRLSTWFVLVGIAAWAMACRPCIGVEFWPGNAQGAYDQSDVYEFDLSILHRLTGQMWGVTIEVGPTGLLSPIVALIAFLAWKGLWVWRARRREMSATQI